MTTDERLKAKKDGDAQKMKDRFCKKLKDLLDKEGLKVNKLSGEIYIDQHNISDILNCKTDPRMSTVFKLLEPSIYTLQIVKKK